MKQGEIYLCDLEPIAGHEQGGKRPVLVISADAFNARTGLPVILPITTGGAFVKKIGFALELPAGMKTVGVIRCDQPRTLDVSARKGRYLETLDSATLAEALERVYAIFD